MFLLSIKAGMRAIEIARVTWNMVTDAERASPTPSRSKIGPQKEARRAHHPAASGPEIRSHRAPPRAGRRGAPICRFSLANELEAFLPVP